jgi:hypothetical protein
MTTDETDARSMLQLCAWPMQKTRPACLSNLSILPMRFVGHPIVLRHDHQLSGERKPVQYSNRRVGKPLPQIVVGHLCSCSLTSSNRDLVWRNIDATSTGQARWEAEH